MKCAGEVAVLDTNKYLVFRRYDGLSSRSGYRVEATFPSQAIDQASDTDTPDPCSNRPRALEGPSFSPYNDERVLKDLIDQLIVVAAAAQSYEEPRRMTLVYRA